MAVITKNFTVGDATNKKFNKSCIISINEIEVCLLLAALSTQSLYDMYGINSSRDIFPITYAQNSSCEGIEECLPESNENLIMGIIGVICFAITCGICCAMYEEHAFRPSYNKSIGMTILFILAEIGMGFALAGFDEEEKFGHKMFIYSITLLIFSIFTLLHVIGVSINLLSRSTPSTEPTGDEAIDRLRARSSLICTVTHTILALPASIILLEMSK